jgi:hypothetical protein
MKHKHIPHNKDVMQTICIECQREIEPKAPDSDEWVLANYDSLDSFTVAYIEAALWSSNDYSDERGGEPLDKNYDIEDLAPETFEEIIKDCEAFQSANRELIDTADYKTSCKQWDKSQPEFYSNDDMAGHDFWLTRNGHGAGFWDRGLGETGEKLTAAAHAFGECNLYVGDDGKLYLD